MFGFLLLLLFLFYEQYLLLVNIFYFVFVVAVVIVGIVLATMLIQNVPTVVWRIFTVYPSVGFYCLQIQVFAPLFNISLCV